MTRLIDADVLHTLFEENCASECAICTFYKNCKGDLYCGLIDNAPTVDITEEQAIDKLHETGWLPKHDKEMTERPQEWIPVSERLPEKYKEVIVTDIETIGTYVSRYIGNEYWECDNGPFNNRIIAWQELPRPYKETDNEKTGM